ncbi:MAG: transposase [Chloroflexi bacterium]|nr:transposase [Chloroflexota bacterium]
MTTYHIGADVDSRITELAVVGGPTVTHFTVPTAIPPLMEVLKAIRSPKVLVIEEGPMADWFCRHLRPVVDELVICDPRRNKLICDDGDKTNRIDAKKLGELSQAKMLRPVYHTDAQDRVCLKQWVSLYADRVIQAVREINKLRARCRMWGVHPPAGALRNLQRRDPWLKTLDPALAGQLRLLFLSFDAASEIVLRCRQELARRAKAYEIVARWQDMPGVGLIRAITFLAYMDTPWRFATRKKAWRYCGVGLQRYASGTDRWGREKPGTQRLAWAANKRLKNVVMGATMSAIHQGDNVIALGYQQRVAQGMCPGNARHAMARKQVDRMMAMWKKGSAYSPELA